MLSDSERILRKYDRESNTRIWTGKAKTAISVLSVMFSLYCIYMTLFSTELPEVRLSRFLAFIIIIGFLHYPAKRGIHRENHIPAVDILVMLAGAACFMYFALNALSIIKVSTRISHTDTVVAWIGILVLFELARRCVGLPIICVAGTLMLYALYNQYSWGMTLPQMLRSIAHTLFYTTNGVIGTPISVCYTYIVLFIIFGAFLEKTGIAQFFISLANRVAGKSSGGPAKVAVISSALCGMVSGSSVGNTVTTGSVTIPMMKKTGYDPEFAAATEAAASTGGQIMPPIMGAAAFLMAEYIGIPYSSVAAKAILPAVLYFTGIFISVHLEAKKLNLKGVETGELMPWKTLLAKSYLLIPLIVLVVLVSTGVRTMQYSAAISIAFAIIVGYANPDVRKGRDFKDSNIKYLKKVFQALEAGAKSAVTVSVACGIAGVIAGCITVTGLASVLINKIVGVAGNVKLIGYLLTMISCIILGMGVPTTANYCIMASTTAPIMISMGVPVVAAHFFVFYFGIVADITPPVALAAYAGSAIAKANPMKTGIKATRLAIAAFIIPFVFAYSPSMLFENISGFWEVAQIVITSIIGIFGVAASLTGYVLRNNNYFERAIYLIGGLTLIVPGLVTDLTGLVLVGGMVLYDFLRIRKDGESDKGDMNVAI